MSGPSSNPHGGRVADLESLAARWVERALPGEAVEVTVGRGTSTTVRAYGGEVESFTSATTFGVGVRVIVDGRQGFAHAGTFDDDAVAEALSDARDNARFAEPDEWVGLAEPDGVAFTDQELWSEAVVGFAAERKVDLAIELERLTRDADRRIKGVRTSVFADGAGEFALASTARILASGRSTSCSLSVQAIAEDAGDTQVGYSVDLGRDPAGLDLAKVASEAAERATRLLGARAVPSCRLTLLLEPRMAATVLGIVAGTLTGEVVVKGRSPFADRLGEAHRLPLLTLVDDPTDARSVGADVVDGEGLACRRNTLVDAGVLRGFLHNAYTGRRAGAASTGSAVRSARSLPGVGVRVLVAEPGQLGWEELVGGVELGLYVQSVSGVHSGVNAVSGDFSVGAEGLMVRGGELAEPVREVTIASTLQRLLQDVSGVGREVEWLPSGAGCPALRIEGVALSGT